VALGFLLSAMARAQAEKGLHGKMEGHAEMDMAVTEGPILKRILSEKGKTAISHYFVMDWLDLSRLSATPKLWKLLSPSITRQF
jgi:hypothetical protein